MPQSSLSILNMFKIYKHNFLHLFRFLEPGGAALRVQKKAWAGARREQRRDMITCAKSVKIGLSSFKSVLIGIRPLLEIPWNGEAARHEKLVIPRAFGSKLVRLFAQGFPPKLAKFAQGFPNLDNNSQGHSTS